MIGLWGADTRPHSWSEDEWHDCCGGELPNDRKVTFCLKIPLLGFHPPGTAVHESDNVLARLFTETLISSEDWRQVSITCSMGYNRKNEDGFYIRCGVSTGIYYVKRARSTTVFSMTALHTHTHTHTHTHICVCIWGFRVVPGVKNLPANSGDARNSGEVDLIPGSERALRVGSGNPL